MPGSRDATLPPSLAKRGSSCSCFAADSGSGVSAEDVAVENPVIASTSRPQFLRGLTVLGDAGSERVPGPQGDEQAVLPLSKTSVMLLPLPLRL